MNVLFNSWSISKNRRWCCFQIQFEMKHRRFHLYILCLPASITIELYSLDWQIIQAYDRFDYVLLHVCNIIHMTSINVEYWHSSRSWPPSTTSPEKKSLTLPWVWPKVTTLHIITTFHCKMFQSNWTLRKNQILNERTLNRGYINCIMFGWNESKI